MARVVVDEAEGTTYVQLAEAPTVKDAVELAERELGMKPIPALGFHPFLTFHDSPPEKVWLTPCAGHPEFEDYYAEDPEAFDPPLRPTGKAIRYWKFG